MTGRITNSKRRFRCRWTNGNVRERLPTAFDRDVASLEALVEVVTTQPGFFKGRRHPIFGSLSEAAWMRWGYLHMDHHLRQFGV